MVAITEPAAQLVVRHDHAFRLNAQTSSAVASTRAAKPISNCSFSRIIIELHRHVGSLFAHMFQVGQGVFEGCSGRAKGLGRAVLRQSGKLAGGVTPSDGSAIVTTAKNHAFDGWLAACRTDAHPPADGCPASLANIPSLLARQLFRRSAIRRFCFDAKAYIIDTMIAGEGLSRLS